MYDFDKLTGDWISALRVAKAPRPLRQMYKVSRKIVNRHDFYPGDRQALG